MTVKKNSYIPFIAREEVDKEHILKVGKATVFFLKDTEEDGMKKATETLFKDYEQRMLNIA
jgi:hypothetical protein